MPYFFVKLIPPRPTFDDDMTEGEQKTMHVHFDYWTELWACDAAVVFGPVMDRAGLYGMGILETADEASALALAKADPAVSSGLMTTTVAPMRVGKIREAKPAKNH